MGIIKKLFAGKEVSVEEKARRTGAAAENASGFVWPAKPYSQMDKNERISLWSEIEGLEDIVEKVCNLEKLADLGEVTACLSLFHAYVRLESEKGVPIDFPKLTKYLKYAAEQDIPVGHLYLAKVSLSPRNPGSDIDLAVEELCRAVACGEEQAAEEMMWYCSVDNAEAAAAARHRFESALDGYVRKAVGAEPCDDPERFEVLLAEPEQVAEDRYNMFGILYYYGIYYSQDLNKAKRYFELAKNDVMLANPIFDEDDEEE